MLKKEEYFKSVRRQYPPLFVSLIFDGYANYNHYKSVIDGKFAMRNQIKVDHVWYYSQAEINRGSMLAYKTWMNPKKLSRVKKEFAKREKSLLKAAKASFKTFCQAYENYMPTLALIWIAEVPVNQNIRKFLGTKMDNQKMERLLDDLNIPLQDNFYKREEYELVKAADLKKHVKKYEWVHSRYGEIHPYTVEQAKAALRKINKTRFLKEWTKNKDRVKKSVIKAKKLLTEKEKTIVDLMQYIVYYRTHRTDIMNRSHYVLIPILQRLATERGLTYKQLLHCTKEEVLGNIPSIEVLEARINDHAFVMENGKAQCFIGKDCERIKKYFFEEVSTISEFKGTVACQGLVKGVARIVRLKEDFGKIKKGDILVTDMTNPHMLPIMKVAGAFVTDEGGITCHAAIISRELRKPCIIGTKIATQALKDGDMVEVDANNGIVKKL